MQEMALRYELTEKMAGTHHFVDPAFGSPTDRECYFKLKWGTRLLKAFGKSNDAKGVVFVDGLTPREAPCEGTLNLDYPGKTLTYDLSFDQDGKRYRLVAVKHDVDLRRPVALVKTHTTAYGTLTDEKGNLVSKSVLHFALEDVPRLLGSLRLKRA
jgi:hypothetical protein